MKSSRLFLLIMIITLLYSNPLSSSENMPLLYFDAPVIISFLDKAYWAQLWDEDHDGDLDILVGGDGKLILLQNDGQGQFVLMKTYPIKGYVRVIKDINGDGLDDFVILGGGSSLSLYIQQIDKSFTRTSVFQSANNPSDVLCLDVNQDKQPDLIIGNKGTNNLSVYLNRGNGNFDVIPDGNYDANQPQEFLASGDWDGDGDQDLVAFYNDSQKNLLRYTQLINDGTGAFRKTMWSAIGVQIFNVYVADIDGNNIEDIIIFTDHGPMISTIPKYISFSENIIGEDYKGNGTVVDVDRDGDIDIIGNGFIAYNNGKGLFDKIYRYQYTGSYSKEAILTTGDITGDNYCDIVYTSCLFTEENHPAEDKYQYAVIAIEGNNTRLGSEEWVLEDGSYPGCDACLIASDMNSDGSDDISFIDEEYFNTQTDSFWVFPHNGPSRPGKGTQHSIGNAESIYELLPVDINKDGYKDLVIVILPHSNDPQANGKLQLRVALTGKQSPLTKDDNRIIIYNLPGSKYIDRLIKTDDVNGDTYDDLLVINGSELIVFLNKADGSGTLYDGINYNLAEGWENSNPRELVLGDIDRDNDIDVIVRYTYGFSEFKNQSSKLVIALNNGKGIFYPPKYIDCPIGTIGLTLADVNSDDDLDVVTTFEKWNTNSREFSRGITVFLNDGSGELFNRKTIMVPLWKDFEIIDIYANDLTSDGVTDLLAVGHEVCFLVHGDKIGCYNLDSMNIYSNKKGVIGPAFTDFDRDGDVDILWCFKGANRITLWRNNLKQ